MPYQNTTTKISSSLQIIGKFTARGLFLGSLWGIIFVIYCFFNNLEGISKDAALLSAHDQQLLLVPTLALTTVGFLLGIVSVIYNLIYPKDRKSINSHSDHHEQHHPDDPAEMIWRVICSPFRMFIAFIQRNNALPPADPVTKSDLDTLLGDAENPQSPTAAVNYGSVDGSQPKGDCIRTANPTTVGFFTTAPRTTTVPGVAMGSDSREALSENSARCSTM